MELPTSSAPPLTTGLRPQAPRLPEHCANKVRATVVFGGCFPNKNLRLDMKEHGSPLSLLKAFNFYSIWTQV